MIIMIKLLLLHTLAFRSTSRGHTLGYENMESTRDVIVSIINEQLRCVEKEYRHFGHEISKQLINIIPNVIMKSQYQ